MMKVAIKAGILVLSFELSVLSFAVAAPPASKAASKPAPVKIEGGIVQIGQEVTVSSDTFVEGSVVVLGGGARILGVVDEDVAVMGGAVLIDNEIKGSVFVLGKSLTLGPRAVVGGDLTTLGAQLTKSAGAVVKGETVALQGMRIGVLGTLAAVAAFVAALFFWLKVFASLGWAILAVLLAALFPSALEASSEYLSERPVVSLGAGILLVPAALLVAAALVVSVIGLALLPLLVVALAAIGVWGYLTVGFWIGDRLFRSMQMYGQAWLACLLGITIIQILRWAPLVGPWVTAVAFVFGVGAAIMTFLLAVLRRRMKAVKVS